MDRFRVEGNAEAAMQSCSGSGVDTISSFDFLKEVLRYGRAMLLWRSPGWQLSHMKVL
jgi:hypothetical protein